MLFNGKNKIALCKSTMKDIFIQQGLHITLEHKKPVDVVKAMWENKILCATP